MGSAVSPVRMITFDLDDTLWPCWPVIRHAEQILYAWLQQRAPRVALAHDTKSLRSHRVAFAQSRPDLKHDLTALRRLALHELLAEHAHDVALAAEGSDVFCEARDLVEPFDEVASVLRRLRDRFILVSVTNGTARVENTPLRGLFHLSLTAAEVGAARPDPTLFAAALDYGGVAAYQALHVGDDAQLDVATAHSLGMYTAWIDRAGIGWTEQTFSPDFRLSDLRELEYLLGDARVK